MHVPSGEPHRAFLTLDRDNSYVTKVKADLGHLLYICLRDC